jgi:6-phosphogluconate dehydrogenase (decarboxylating)
VQQVTRGDFDVNDLVGFTSNSIIVSRGDMNHASEIYSFDLKKNTWKQITNVNTTYDSLLSKTERRYVTTTDGKKMLVWVILPNFDATKSIQHFYIAKEDHKAP